MTEHKHCFKFVGVKDAFLYKHLQFMCRTCFFTCYLDREEFYSVLTEAPKEVNWDDLWR